MNGISTNRRCTSSAACLRQAGIEFVIRYYSETTQQPQKHLIPGEAEALHDAGLRLAAVYQDRQNTVGDFNRAAGQRDGRFAFQYARETGQPQGTGIFFAVDYDAQPGHLATIKEYFKGVAEGLAAASGSANSYLIGVYGNGYICRRLKDAGLVVHTWLSESTGHLESSTYTGWNVKQFVTNQNLCSIGNSWQRCVSQGNDDTWSFRLGEAPAPIAANQPAAVLDDGMTASDFPAPKPLPSGDPIPFATSDVDDAVWPIKTSHPRKFEVNYKATDGSPQGGNPGRQFLAMRSNGARYHVGLDLFAYDRDIVVACEDGRVVAYYGFYNSSAGELTWALLIEHEDFVINYGEVKGGAQQEFGWHVGDTVQKGQEIARVSTTDMIHFETYLRGTYQNQRWMVGQGRPQTLLNPSLYLLSLAAAAQGMAAPAIGDGGAPVEGPLLHPSLAGNTDLQMCAAGQRRAFIKDRDHGPATGLIQDGLDRVLPSAQRINAGTNRGTFGPRTEAGVMAFQRQAGLIDDGKAGKDTLRALDAALIALDGGTPSPAPVT